MKFGTTFEMSPARGHDAPMPRRRRAIIPGVPHHVTQRAAHGRYIIESNDSKAILIDLLAQWANRTGVLVGGFVLMNNHFHMCLTPPSEDALSLMIGRATAFLSRWINVGLRDVGPNWQGAFYAAPMDDEHTIAALRYIERNPVAAKLTSNPCDWRWSSAAWHAGLGPKPAIISTDYRLCTEAKAWRDSLDVEQPELLRRKIHAATTNGDPLADDQWIDRMEAVLGRPLRRRPRGRPPENGPGGTGRI